VSHKFIKKLQTMARVEASLKSPSIPVFSKGEVSLTPLWTRAEGEFLGGMRGELWREFLGQDTRSRRQKKKRKIQIDRYLTVHIF